MKVQVKDCKLSYKYTIQGQSAYVVTVIDLKTELTTGSQVSVEKHYLSSIPVEPGEHNIVFSYTEDKKCFWIAEVK